MKKKNSTIEDEELVVPDDAAETQTDEDAATTAEEQELDEVVERYVSDEDEDDLGEISFKTVLGGDLLQSPFFRRQVMFIIFIAGLLLFYTGNRYSSQQDIITIDSLKVRLQQERYNVLTQSSELLNLSRQSNIEQQLRLFGDSALANPTTPPYEIEVKK
ncbi:MAG: hypothetical protein II801_04430 [Bacteroidaceae bacterium]|nr:hypothetical protein [Bacteroidaceae bacterium]